MRLAVLCAWMKRFLMSPFERLAQLEQEPSLGRLSAGKGGFHGALNRPRNEVLRPITPSREPYGNVKRGFHVGQQLS